MKKTNSFFRFIIPVTFLLHLTSCQGEERTEEPPIVFSKSFPKRFLNPEKIFGNPFCTISNGDSVFYYFTFDKKSKSSEVKVISRNDTSIFNKLYLNRHRDLYFWNRPNEDSLWQISAFRIDNDTSVTGFSEAITFQNNMEYFLGLESHASLLKEENGHGKIVEGNKKELYLLFSDIIDNYATSERIVTQPSMQSPDISNIKTVEENTTSGQINSAVTIFPNPATDKITISGISKGTHLALRNSEDETLVVKIIDGTSEELTIANLKPATYFLLVVNPETGKKETFQVIKK